MPNEHKHRQKSAWLVPAIVAAVAAILITAVIALGRDGEPSEDDSEAARPAPDNPTDVQEPDQPDLTEVERRDDEDPLVAGPVDAPVALVVFSDYQCPFCAKWNDETLPLLMEHVESGDLRVEWRDVNVFGSASERAAKASYAAALQGKFWEYHDELFAGGEHRSQTQLSEEALITLAEDLDLDPDRFATDFASAETAEEIDNNAQLGMDLGAHSTPAFLLGGQPIMGAQPSQVFLDAFQDALDTAE